MTKIVMLAGKGRSTRIVYNALRQDLEIERVIIEEKVSRFVFLKKRVKQLGYARVLGQVMFQGTVVPYLQRRSRARISEIKCQYGLDDSEIDREKIVRVNSANAKQVRALLREIDPRIVVINGTRILSKKVLGCIDGVFVNMHAGITPLYRGVHGAYWALVEQNTAACGVTVHLVDTGIDTGNVLQQALIQPTADDNFVTYPLLQLGEGLPLLKQALRELSEDSAEIKAYPQGVSKLWSHPSLWEYVKYRLTRSVR